MKDKKIVQSAIAGDRTAFQTLYDKLFENAIIGRYEQNDQFFQELFKDEAKLNFIKSMLRDDLYGELRGRFVI